MEEEGGDGVEGAFVGVYDDDVLFGAVGGEDFDGDQALEEGARHEGVCSGGGNFVEAGGVRVGGELEVYALAAGEGDLVGGLDLEVVDHYGVLEVSFLDCVDHQFLLDHDKIVDEDLLHGYLVGEGFYVGDGEDWVVLDFEDVEFD